MTELPRRRAIRMLCGGAVAGILALAASRAGASRRNAAGLRVVTRDTPAIGGPAAQHGRTFASETGLPVEVVRLPFDRLYDEIMIGFVSGRRRHDVLIIPSGWLADFAPFLAPVPDRLLTGDAVADIHPTYRDALMRWDGRWLAMTIDGDLHIGAYRTDLFADRGHRAAFERRHGRPLAPPRTWAEYRDIAAFFHGRRQPGGPALAGTAEAFADGGQRIWFLASRAAAYATPPGRRGTMFFDPEGMAPSIDSPAWVRALTEYHDTLAFTPPDARQMDSYGVRTAFVDGRVAMNIDWTDTGVLAADRSRSAVAGRTGSFMLPGSRDAWDPDRRTWRRFAAPRRVPFLAFGGWVAAVPAASPVGDLAWDFIAWLSSPAQSARDVADGTSGINVYRLSHLENPGLWGDVFRQGDASAYLQVIRDSLDHHMVARDLRIPGVRAYQAALDRGIGRVLAGGATPAVALAAVAVQWELITDRLGRSAQRRHYRAAMGLDPN